MAGVLAYLEKASLTPFEWGYTDCLMFVGDWILEARGVDPGAPYRGRYKTERQCRRILKAAGGLVALMQERGEACGLSRADSLKDGDCGAISVPVVRGRRQVMEPTGAIYCAGRWTAHGRAGLFILEATPLAAWSI